MSSVFGDRPAEFFTALRASLGAAPGEPKLTQIPGSDGMVFSPSGKAYTLPAVSVREHVFEDAPSMAEWLIDRSGPAEAEILVDEVEAVAVLGAGSPRHDTVRLKLKHHPAFQRWAGVFGRPLTQKALHALLRRAKGDFRKPSNPDAIGAGERFLAAVAKLQVSKSTQWRRDIGDRGETLLKASDSKTEVSAVIPDEIEIDVPIFVGVEVGWRREPTYTITVFVELDTDGDQPIFTLSAPDLALQLLEARQDVAQCLREKLGDGWTVGLGKASTRVVLTAPAQPQISLSQELGRLLRVPLVEPVPPTPTTDHGDCGPATDAPPNTMPSADEFPL